MKTIALFGATGRTGHHFLRYALEDDDLRIRALVRNPRHRTLKWYNDALAAAGSVSRRRRSQMQRLDIIEGRLEDVAMVERTVKGAKYVVCMVAAGATGEPYPKDCMSNFAQQLTILLQEMPASERPRLVVYQAGCLSTDGAGQRHWLSTLLKDTRGTFQRQQIEDNDSAIQFLAKHSPVPFLVTRAGAVREFDDIALAKRLENDPAYLTVTSATPSPRMAPKSSLSPSSLTDSGSSTTSGGSGRSNPASSTSSSSMGSGSRKRRNGKALDYYETSETDDESGGGSSGCRISEYDERNSSYADSANNSDDSGDDEQQRRQQESQRQEAQTEHEAYRREREDRQHEDPQQHILSPSASQDENDSGDDDRTSKISSGSETSSNDGNGTSDSSSDSSGDDSSNQGYRGGLVGLFDTNSQATLSFTKPPLPWMRVSYRSLALLTLDVLEDTSVYRTCPFVVPVAAANAQEGQGPVFATSESAASASTPLNATPEGGCFL